MIIGKTIIVLREHKSWSLSELSRQSGVSKGVLSDIESGKATNVPLFTLQALASAFDVSVGTLIDSETCVLPITVMKALEAVNEAQTPHEMLCLC